MEFRRYAVDRSELERWLARMARELAGVSGLVAAVLYGSAAEGLPFRDLDIALIVDREVCPEERDWDLENGLADRLARLVPVPVDVHVVNDAPLALRYNVTRGRPFWVSDPERYADFLEQSWDLYFDFAPVSRRYLEEMVEW
ncbi:MAG: hypothetical protein ACPLYD_05985 [Anaerolineae bacterium]